MEKEEKKKELNHNQNFVEQISNSLSQLENSKSIEEATREIENLVQQADALRKDIFSIKAEMTIYENETYMNQHKLHIVEQNLIETEKDIEFAMKQENELVCPTCGAVYFNGLTEQMNISSDYAHCEKLKMELIEALDVTENTLSDLAQKYEQTSSQLKSLELKIQKSQEFILYSSYYKNKGQYEIYEACGQQLNTLEKKVDEVTFQIAKLDDEINEMKSKKRSKEIKDKIEGNCRILADKINVPKTFIKLRDFVQVIDHTGSETPRIVYMYQSALYLYNLERTDSPFNFYIIDTPNQQGQDTDNLESIFKSLKLIMSDDGQVIVGTEREMGMEDKANNVIRLIEKRRCLSSEKYNEHIELFQKLQNLAINWVAENHKKQKEVKDEMIE